VNRVFVVLAFGAAALAAPGAGAQPKAMPVRFDFRVLTEDGAQVRDLKAEELSLKVNGKPRQIQSLSRFSTVSDKSSPGSDLPPPYASNAAGASGRAIHILIDDDSIAPGREAEVREAVRLITSELGPDDRVGVMTAQGQLNIRPGADPTKVRLAVDNLSGRAVTKETEQDAQCRTVKLLAALSTVISVSGSTPTTIVLFAGGMSPPKIKQVQIGSLNSSAATNDLCPVTTEDFQNIGNLAGSAHADLYVFHVTEGMVERSTTQAAGIESLAGVTGSEIVRLNTTAQPSIARMLRETSAYYVGTFEPDPGERTGSPMRLELRTTRDKVRVRARPVIEIPKETKRAALKPQDMLRVAGEHHELPLRAAAYTSRAPGSEDVKIVALFEGVEPGATLASASVGLFDEKNTLKKQWTAQSADLAKRPHTAAIIAPPGVYRLRVAAVDAAGRAGTTDYDLLAEVPRADPLKVSALVLGTQQQGTGFAPRLEFSGADAVAIGLLEIYGVPKSSTVTVDLEVAPSLNGTPLANAQTTVSQGTVEDTRIAFGGFSIASLAPGDYQMRAVITLDGKPVGRVVRTLRKTQ